MKWVGQSLGGLRCRLVFLVIVVCSPLLVLTLHNASEDRRRALAMLQREAQELCQLGWRREGELLEETAQLLFAMAEAEPVRSLSKPGCARLLQQVAARSPRYSALGVVKSDGELVACSVPATAMSGTTNGGSFQRALQGTVLAMDDLPYGGMREGRSLRFGCPILDRAGVIQGVVFAAIDWDDFTGLGSELGRQASGAGTWMEVDAAGRVVTEPAQGEGRGAEALAEGWLVRAAVERRKGIVERISAGDVPRFYAFASRGSLVARRDVYGILSVPRRVLFAEANREMWRNLRWMGFAAAVAFVLGWVGSSMLILRPLKALARCVSGAGAGKSSRAQRSQRDALGQLTDSFERLRRVLSDQREERMRETERVQALSRRLVEVQEAERRQLARELHDEIGQNLTVAEMKLEALLQTPASDAIATNVDASLEALERVLEQVRDLSLNLRPSMLDDLGLESALKWYSQREAEVGRLRVEFKAEPLEERLDPLIETECFRIAQEALTNVLRHARASSVRLELTRTDDRVELRIKDDGVGFEVAQARQRALSGASLGLLSMEERALLGGGGMEVRSNPSEGTEVRAWFPLKWRTQAN